jgi:hypothetical protein
MTVEAYLAELRRRLPSTGSRRFLAEVEAHLREATDERVREGLDHADAEARAVEAFGSAEVVAARIWRETAPVAVRRAAGLALVALGALVLPLYVVPENLLPPAPWTDRPSYLSVLLATALVTWVFAGVHAAFAFVAPATHGVCALYIAAALALVAGAASLAAGIAWHAEAPSTPWSLTAVAAPLTLVALGVLAAAARWARARAAVGYRA